jgi:dTDP-4-dehydrorhamnose reductase
VPRPTALAGLIARLAAGQSPSHPLFAVPGWWRRPERLTLGNARLKSAPLPTTRPLLIVGRSGTLARAFARVCALRGLPAHTAGRAELDITDHRAIEHLIRRLRPWAIINAAGYVRVDDAEREPEECFRVNAVGPAVLAAVCQRRRLPLLTYSSDLVFDGTKGGSYEEADLPSPLNVYGASKAEAEHSVLSQLPTALVIRTSAFFGPWDQHNFLAHLFDALDRGQVFCAADNAVVSPTYVPDLVHASLDLLIDGERGIWHLANDGAISWYDFAMLAAVRSERSVDLIEPVSAATLTGAAARPAFTALASSRGRLLRSLDDALAAFLSEIHDLEMESSRCASR